MGEAGARRARERFSWRRAAEEMTAIYEDVCGRRASRRAQELVR
jgi:glycosyltransferase involved in cell wall biosynthesis